MAKVKLTLKGFDALLDDIQKAGGEIEPATERALESSAQLVTQKIKEGANARGVGTRTLINPKTKWSGNRASIEVGYNLGAYNSASPSEGYLALFFEYGTGKRTTKRGANRGKMNPDPFVRKAVSDNAKQIKAAQEKALDRILKELKG